MKKNDSHLILEFTEFNLQRLNPINNNEPVVSPDNKQLSLNAYDRYVANNQSLMSRIDSIAYGSNIGRGGLLSLYKKNVLLEEQNIKNLKIIRIFKNNNMDYDVYITFDIDDVEYNGMINNILSYKPSFTTNAFSDRNLIQTKTWQIRTNGEILRCVRTFLKPEIGKYKYINTDIITIFSKITSTPYQLKQDDIITLINAYNNKLIISIDGTIYELKNDTLIYFKWWFEKTN